VTPRGLLGKLNERVAIRVTLMVATMECVYAFLILALLPLMDHRLEPAIQYLSSGVLQLVLLPMIMVGQALLGRDAEARARQDHEAIMAEMAELKEIHALLAEGRP
jgi:hypothetical protein